MSPPVAKLRETDEWVSAREVAGRAGITPAAARQRLLRAGIHWRRGPGRGGPKLYRIQDVQDVVLRPIATYALWRVPDCPTCSTRLKSCVVAYREQLQQLSRDYPGGIFPGGQWRELSPPACNRCGQRIAITYTINDSGEESVTWRPIRE